MAATFDERALAVEEFPVDQKTLEIAWAQRFVDALEKQKAGRYTVFGSALHIGADVLLRPDSGPDVQLQVTEAVDYRRIDNDKRRKWYVKAIAKAEPTLKSAFVGIQIALIDDGLMINFPNANTKEGLAIAASIAQFLLRLQTRASAYPVCPPGRTPHHNAGIEFKDPAKAEWSIVVFLTRYAPVGVQAPAQWQWASAGLVGGPPAPQYIRDAIRNKLDGNFTKILGEQLWLLVYTVDCPYDAEQEADIQSLIATTRNPFDRIFVLDRSRTRQVFPLVDDPQTAPPKAGFFILGSDAIPAVNDPRYRDIE
jgi:hypothetical protein